MNDLLNQLTDLDKLTQLIEKSSEQGTWNLDSQQLTSQLKGRVRGQDHVIDDLAPLLARQYAKFSRRRPVANLLFVGPTGTGKSELCRAMAQFLFENENTRLQYDCGQFKDSAGIARLVGSPQGYVGGAGELTKAMMANKKRIVVFDEIEKAHHSLYDLFLSMMGDGRLADQRSGKEADFTESIIVLTSNAEQDVLTRMQSEISNSDELNNALRVHLRESGTFRPEIIGRIDRIYVFKELEGIVRAEIVALKMRKLAAEYGLELVYVDPTLIFDAMSKGDKLRDFGARQREQIVEDLLAQPLLDARTAGVRKARIVLSEGGQLTVQAAGPGE